MGAARLYPSILCHTSINKQDENMSSLGMSYIHCTVCSPLVYRNSLSVFETLVLYLRTYIKDGTHMRCVDVQLPDR